MRLQAIGSHCSARTRHRVLRWRRAGSRCTRSDARFDDELRDLACRGRLAPPCGRAFGRCASCRSARRARFASRSRGLQAFDERPLAATPLHRPQRLPGAWSGEREQFARGTFHRSERRAYAGDFPAARGRQSHDRAATVAGIADRFHQRERRKLLDPDDHERVRLAQPAGELGDAERPLFVEQKQRRKRARQAPTPTVGYQSAPACTSSSASRRNR